MAHPLLFTPLTGDFCEPEINPDFIKEGVNAMERYENTNPRIVADDEAEQFVAYDSRGKAVVLQKNSNTPANPFFRRRYWNPLIP